MLDPHFMPTESTPQMPVDPSSFDPQRDPSRVIYLEHPNRKLRIIYWRGRVADLLIDRLGYTEITREAYYAEASS